MRKDISAMRDSKSTLTKSVCANCSALLV